MPKQNVTRPAYVAWILEKAKTGVKASDVIDNFGGHYDSARYWLNGLADAGTLRAVGKRPIIFYLNT